MFSPSILLTVTDCVTKYLSHYIWPYGQWIRHIIWTWTDIVLRNHKCVLCYIPSYWIFKIRRIVILASTCNYCNQTIKIQYTTPVLPYNQKFQCAYWCCFIQYILEYFKSFKLIINKPDGRVYLICNNLNLLKNH